MRRWHGVVVVSVLAACVAQPAPVATEEDVSSAPTDSSTSLPALSMTPSAAIGGRVAASQVAVAGRSGSGDARGAEPPLKGASAGAIEGAGTGVEAGSSAGAGAQADAGAGAGVAGLGAAGAAADGVADAAPSQLCAAMVASAQELLISLDTDALKTAVQHPFEARHKFAYEPQVAERPGASLMMMSEAQREKALALVRSGLSDEGFQKAETTRALENLKAVTGFQINMRDPLFYWLAIFGEPSETGAWGWQFEGHHLALHFTLKACAIADTPVFMGAWPAQVATMVDGGPPAGSRNLEQEEELGRVLAKSIDADPAKRAQAFQASAYRQMLPQGPDRAQPMMPAGLPGSAMSESERKQLEAIVSHYASLMHPQLAAARLRRIEEHGGFENVSFVWTGALEPKQRHFYRVQGPSFFIEYRNDDGNHIHSAWRDFQGDWGDDLP